jgi:hypothetical protein
VERQRATHLRLLRHNLLQYVTDNVLVLMLASSISMVGVTLIDKSELPYLLTSVRQPASIASPPQRVLSL